MELEEATEDGLRDAARRSYRGRCFATARATWLGWSAYVPQSSTAAPRSLPVEVTERLQVSAISIEPVSICWRLLHYVQIQGTGRVFFKSVGDPRVMSRSSGMVHPDLAALGAVGAP